MWLFPHPQQGDYPFLNLDWILALTSSEYHSTSCVSQCPNALFRLKPSFENTKRVVL